MFDQIVATSWKVTDMSMDPQEFLALLSRVQNDLDGVPTPKEMRADLDEFAKRVVVADGVTTEETSLGGVPCLKVAPQTAGDGNILYFHGGGYIAGSPQSHLGLTSYLAKRTNCTVWSPDYRLAPESPFPAALDDAVASYQGLLEKVGSANRIVISGDSAGGGLSIASMFEARKKGIPMAAGLAVMSPFADLTLSGWSHDVVSERDFLATPKVLEVMASWYSGKHDPSDDRISPCFGNFAGFPPMLIHVGSEEVLLSDSTRLAERAGEAQVPVELKVWPLMPHVFQLHTKFLTSAVASVEEISDWISDRLDPDLVAND